MRREDWCWLAFWAGFTALDLWADTRGKSLCTSARRLTHAETPAGRAHLTALVASGSFVLWRHLLKPEVPGGPDALTRIRARLATARFGR